MTNPAKLAAQLRFHLSEMGANNAFHAFEHLARHVARARVHSNILPATGPVSGGGDQGADFETFRSHIRPGLDTDFALRSSGEKRIVFASSLEKKIEGKIRADVASIVSHGNADGIAYFCEANLSVAKRNKLKEQAPIPLDIFDGNAIAEFLAEPDLFWIAQEYLHVPAEIVPTVQREDEYAALKRDWDDRAIIVVNHADFVSVKSGLRRTTRIAGLAPDLGFWLGKMTGFLAPDAPRGLHRSACYEIALAHLRGRREMTSQRALIEDYFSDLADFPGQGDMTDAVVLLHFCSGALHQGAFEVPVETVAVWFGEVHALLEAEFAAAPGPGRKAGLLYLMGMMTALAGADGSGEGILPAISRWNEMLDHAEQAPLYPLEHFADYLLETVRFHGTVPELLDLAARNDALVAKRLGAVTAGNKAVARAMSLIETDQPILAIRELQRAKANWMSGERLPGSLSVLLLLARLYLDLGLAYAAKYHAGLAAYMARYESADAARGLHAQAIAMVLDAENAAGNGFGFMQMLNVHLGAHLQFDDIPLDPDRHPDVHENIGQMAALLGVLKRVDPVAREAVDDVARYWPELLRDPIWEGAAAPDGFWMADDWSAMWADLEHSTLDRPFGDLGQRRTIRWKACGISWEVEFANTYRTTATAEQLVAELQAIACALAGRDLGIVPSTVRISVVIDPRASEMKITEAPEYWDFLVQMPEADYGFESLPMILTLLVSAVDLCSVFGPERLAEAFDRQVIGSGFVGRPYAEIYRDLMVEEGFRADIRAVGAPLDPDRPFSSRAGDRVPWFNGPLLLFDIGRAEGDAQNRYKVAVPFIRHSIAGVNNDPEAALRLAEMHARGMSDWEIASILSNVALNRRGTVIEGEDRALLAQRWRALMETPEQPGDALDPSVFSTQALAAGEQIYLAAFMASWELPVPPNRDRDGLETFLVHRMMLRSVDVPHETLFLWQEGTGEVGQLPPI